MPWSRDPDSVSSGYVIPILSYFLLLTKLPIPFILQSYRLFHNSMMSDLSTDQPIVEIIAVAEKRSVFFLQGHRPTQSLIM